MRRTSLHPDDSGWPYPDPTGDFVDVAGEADDDLIAVRSDRHLMDGLSPLEREVVTARFGLGGAPLLSMKQLQSSLGLPRADLRIALGSGLDKLRTHLS